MRGLFALGMLLLVAAFLRMAGLVLGDPLAGQANNYDFVRLEACLGLWPEGRAADRTSAHLAAPIARYVRGPRIAAACQPNPALMFPLTAMVAHRVFAPPGTPMPLRWVGLATLGFVAGAMIAVALALRRHPIATVVHGLIALAVLADPLVTLYFNTLYAEPATFLGAYLLVGLLVAAHLRGGLSAWSAAGIAAGALLLGLSKEQFFLLPLALVLAASLMGSWRAMRARAFLAALAATVVPVVLFFVPVSDVQRPYAAHRIDAYLGALADSSADPARTLAVLGLPSRCGALVGGSWHRLRGEDLSATCPEVVALPHAAFVDVLRHEPRTVAAAALMFVVNSQNAYSGYMGILEGAEFAQVDALAAWRGSLWTLVFTGTPPAFFAAAAIGFIAALLALVPALVLRRGPGNAHAVLLALLGLLAAYVEATALLGDGFVDAGKHAWLAACALLSAGVALAALLVPALRREARRHLALVGCATAIGIGIAIAVFVASLRIPLIFGLLDRPEGRSLEFEGPNIEGWALGVHGIASVEIEVAGRRIAAHLGEPHRGLELVFPAVPGSDRAGFSATVNPEDLPDGAVLRVFATDTRGVAREIDRRRIAAPPVVPASAT